MKTMQQIKQQAVLDALSYYNGNRTHAARVLDISIRTLRNSINRCVEQGIEVTRSSKNMGSSRKVLPPAVNRKK